MVSACTRLLILGIYLLFAGLALILDVNSSLLFSWISYYLIGPFLVVFIILIYYNVSTQGNPYDLRSFEGKNITYLNGKIMENVINKLRLLLFFWTMYYAVSWIDSFVPLYGVNILYEFGKGLFCSLLSVSRIDLLDLKVRTFNSNFIAFYGSLHIFLKGIETLGY